MSVLITDHLQLRFLKVGQRLNPLPGIFYKKPINITRIDVSKGTFYERVAGKEVEYHKKVLKYFTLD